MTWMYTEDEIRLIEAFTDEEHELFNDTECLIRPGDVGVLMPSSLEDSSRQDYEAWKRFIARWQVPAHCPVPMELEVSWVHKSRAVLHAHLRALDAAVDNPGFKMKEYSVSQMLPTVRPVAVASDRWLRALLRWWWCHELDEWLRIDGKRVFDPHVRFATPTPENS